jgi:hypothetical protein
MDKLKKPYQKPEVAQVSLVPNEAVLEVCKNHELVAAGPTGGSHCEHPVLSGMPAPPCHGVTGS